VITELSPLAMGWNPLSIPSSFVTVFLSWVQGALKGDCVRVWLPPTNWKFTRSPGLAMITFGVNTSAGWLEASAPTTTVRLAAKATVGRTAARARKESILKIERETGSEL